MHARKKGNHHEYARNPARRRADARPPGNRFRRCCDDRDRIYLGRLGHGGTARDMSAMAENSGRMSVLVPMCVAQFTASDGAVAKFKAASSYSKDTVVGEYVKTVAATNMDYSFAKACAAGVETELAKTATKS